MSKYDSMCKNFCFFYFPDRLVSSDSLYKTEYASAFMTTLSVAAVFGLLLHAPTSPISALIT